MSDGGHYSVRKVRRSAGYFLAGKAVGGLLTMTVFTVTARWLGIANYGTYATLIAAVELLMALGTLGLDWTVGRYLPEYRARADASQLRQFLGVALSVQVGFLLLIALVAASLSDWIARHLGLTDSRIAIIYAAVLVVEGAARVLRDQFLGSLMAQGAAQLATLTRSASLLAMLALMSLWSIQNGEVLLCVAGAELAASMLSLAVGFYWLARLARRHQPDAAHSGSAPWRPPLVRAIAVLSRNALVNSLLVMPSSGPVITLVLRALAGSEAAGAFGFARGLVDQIRKFLPSELFFGLIRAAVVARYAVSRDFGALNRQVGLAFALSVMAAMPVLAALWGQPALVAGAIGGVSFVDVAPVLAVWSASLLLLGHRRAVELVAYTVGRSQACMFGGLVLALGPGLLAALLATGLAVPLALVAPLAADLGFSLVVVLVLRHGGVAYRWSATTLWRLALILTTATLAMVWIPLVPSTAVLQLGACGTAALALTWGAAAAIRPFSAAEREMMNRLLPRPWFVF
jgi:O-antigen/teichoic acid export membrane protein